MKKFLGIFTVGIIVVIGGCDLQPKIASIPDDVGDFISTRYPTLLAEPDSEIYKTAVADYGVYASATEYGNGDITENDYVLYSPADDYMMPAQDTDVPDVDVGMPDSETEDVEDETYAPDTDVDDLKIPDYVDGKPKAEPEVKAEQKAQAEKVEEADDEKMPETMRAPLREITIEKGDTLYSVSRKYSVPVNDLAVLNKISAPFTLSVGQKIKVPDVLSVPEYKTPQRAATVKPEAKAVVTEKTVTPKVAESKPADVKKPADTKKVETKKVEKTDVKTKSVDAKNTKTETAVKQADKKKVEAKSTVTKESKTAEAPQKKADTKSVTNKKADAKTKTVDTKKSAQTPKTEKTTAKTATKKETKVAKADTKKSATDTKKTTQQKRTAKQLAARSSSKFSWPLRGKILSGFGSKPNGLVNDGINIKGTKGANVLAAENGFVAYAGNEVKGMGNLVIVQHADGFMTVYAHMDTMNVRRGSTVVVGQKIGTVGQSGKVDQPQLHFEIRKGTRAYNPINYLKK